MKYELKSKKVNSFTLIEVLVGVFLILIIFLGIFGAYQLGLRVVGLSKNKIIATTIANQQLEIIKNLPYQSVGTRGAVLPYAEGILESATTTIRNNVEFTINTKVKYMVDSADGLVSPPDSCYLDYKRAEIKVSWPGRFKGEVKLVTDIAPKNKIEEINSCTAQPGGILSVTVFDAYGEAVPLPLIEIFNPTTGQKITSYSPSNGKSDFPLVATTYKVVVSKDGYSSEQTYTSGDVYNGITIITPEKPHPIILEGRITQVSFSIDRLSSFLVRTLSPPPQEIPIGEVTFNVKGTKVVGLDKNDNPIYKYSLTTSTDSNGQKNLPNLEWDSYTFSIDPTSGLDLVATDPSPQPIGLSPNTNLEVNLYLKAENSLLVTVQNHETLEPVFAANVRLYNTGLGYDVSQYTNEKGQTIFIPLKIATYNLEVSAPGYSTVSTTAYVSGDVAKTVKIEKIE